MRGLKGTTGPQTARLLTLVWLPQGPVVKDFCFLLSRFQVSGLRSQLLSVSIVPSIRPSPGISGHRKSQVMEKSPTPLPRNWSRGPWSVVSLSVLRPPSSGFSFLSKMPVKQKNTETHTKTQVFCGGRALRSSSDLPSSPSSARVFATKSGYIRPYPAIQFHAQPGPPPHVGGYDHAPHNTQKLRNEPKRKMPNPNEINSSTLRAMLPFAKRTQRTGGLGS